MIILVRGTNGSGKSHTIRTILSQATSSAMATFDLFHGSRLIKLSGVKRPVLVIGPYQENRNMGGCDCIRTPSDIYRLIKIGLEAKCHILLEGVVLASKPYFKLFAEGNDVRLFLIDPPISVCMANIRKRQAEKGYYQKISRTAFISKRRKARAMYEDARKLNMYCRWTDSSTLVVRQILESLRSA